MKWGVLEEYVHDEPSGNPGVHLVSSLDDIVQGIVSLDDYQGAGLLLGHHPAGFRDLVEAVPAHLLLLDSQEFVYHGPALSGHVDVPGSEFHQPVSQLGLEKNDQGEYSDIDESAQDGVHQVHVESRDNDFEDEHGHDCHEYVHGGGAPDPLEYEVDQDCNH